MRIAGKHSCVVISWYPGAGTFMYKWAGRPACQLAARISAGRDHALFITEGRGYASEISSALARIEVIDMPWWETVVFLTAVAVAIWGFCSMVGVNKRWLTRGSGRRAQDLYDDYADSPRKQRRYAREHGGTWSNDS